MFEKNVLDGSMSWLAAPVLSVTDSSNLIIAFSSYLQHGPTFDHMIHLREFEELSFFVISMENIKSSGCEEGVYLLGS